MHVSFFSFIQGIWKKINIILDVQGVSKILISLHNPITWPILIQMISDFCNIYRNNSKILFNVLNAFSFPMNGISIHEKKKKNINQWILNGFYSFS